MSTCNYEPSTDNKEYKQINLFVRDNSSLSILKCDKIDFFEKDFYNIADIYDVECLQEFSNNKESSIDSIQLEEACLSKIVAKYSKKYNRGIINWMLDYNSMPFKQMKRLLPNIPITLVANVNLNKDKGSAGGDLSLFLKLIVLISDLFSYLFSYIKYLPFKNEAYDFFEKNYKISKEFLQHVITQEYCWDKGFIDSNIYWKKNKYERKIMKDLNYKYNRKAKKWIKN